MRILKKTFKKSVSILLTLTMMFGILTIIPIEASAVTGVSYIYRSWNGSKVVSQTKTCTGYTLLSGRSSDTLSDGWYVVDRDMTISDRIRVSGTVNLILCDGKTLTMKAGISVFENDTLNIFGQSKGDGKIYAHPKADDDYSWENSAVIGGTEDNPSAGTINIHGGTLDLDTPSDAGLFWDSKAAALGGGYGDEGEQDGWVKCISIFGGDVKCKSDVGGAAIGGGQYGSAKGIYIYGGKINAESSIIGNDGGAAIGSGYDAPHAGDTIRIYGGDITARASTGAAIGSGDKTDSNNIVISGGAITATATTASGYSGAAIGSGRGGRAHSITISDASIIAVSSSGAGIGSGEDGPANSITISRSFVCAQSLHGGAGIGSGYHGDSNNIEIENSVIFASSKDFKNTQGLVDALDKIGGADIVPPGLPFTSQADFKTATSNIQNYIKVLAGIIYFCTPNHSGAGIGGGVGSAADSIKITGSYVEALAEDYSAAIGSGEDKDFGKIEIINSEIEAESGDYGAAIGSGDEAKKCGTITITNSTVTATAGTDAAGIGTGNETDQSATINITDSTVTAHGGRYAAGIGGGDDVSGGTINITNSTIKEADSKTDGAGIGGGESGHGGTITIKNSNVTAHGGGYAAGIGGGDAGDGGNITIDNSTVKAYGGTDAAGIGGGEGGNGGNITIRNKSDVYAEGKEYGAGIGGGEDAGVGTVSIIGVNCVEAVAGSVSYGGRAVAVGNGDYNSWFSSQPHIGTMWLGKGLKVRAGSSKYSTSVYTGQDRFKAAWENRYAKFFVCEHDNIVWCGYNSAYHSSYCADCHKEMTSTSLHEWDNNNICKICGAAKNTMNLTFVEKGENGNEIRRTEAVFGGDYYALPECENSPGGYGFLSWKVTYSDGSFYFHAPGEKLKPQSLSPVIEATYLPLKKTTYIDEFGKECTVMAKQVSALETTEFLLVVTDGWYVVDKKLDLYGRMRIQGNVRFIIEDGCYLSAEKFSERYKDYIIWYDQNEYSSFSLYGQKNQTGVLDMGYYYGTARFSAFNQYGAVFKAEAAGFNKSCRIYAGTYDTFSDTATDYGEIEICGGKTSLARISFNEEGKPSMELGWTKLSDRIKLVEFMDRGTVKIKDGQAFIDDNGTIYRDHITTEQQEALSTNINIDKTLKPYIGHDYADPEWNWDNEYHEATAVFRCKDCDDVQEIKAKVSCNDSGKNRISTARCIFYGDEYTTTLTKQIIFDVTAASASHGTVTVNKTAAKERDNIKLDITPDNGYALSRLFYTDSDGNKTVISGSSFAMPESNVTVTAEFAPLKKVEYIDENGYTQTAMALSVTNDTTELIEGWYYVEGSVVLQSDTPIYGDVKLILCDSASLKSSVSVYDLGKSDTMQGTSLSVYRAPGENEGTICVDYINAGTINLVGGKITLNRGLKTDMINIYGGELRADDASSMGIECSGDINIYGGSMIVRSDRSYMFNCKGTLNITGGDVEIEGKGTAYGRNTAVRISGGNVNFKGTFNISNASITGGNVSIEKMNSSGDITLGWTDLSDSIYAGSYSANSIKITDGKELTDGSTVYSGTYTKDKLSIFNGKTLIPNYIQHVEKTEPYINENGEYILGTIEHYATGKNKFAVNEDGSVGEKLDSVELSYFDFAQLSDGTYQIKCYTGPMDDLTELEIPMTFKGKAVTVLGDISETFMQGTGTLGKFTLALTKNITMICGSGFSVTELTAITGNTSGLRQIKDMPFFMTNTSDNGKVTISLKYPGKVTVDDRAFTWSNIVVRLAHATTLSSEGNANSIEYIIIDDEHPYGDPVWTWADDYSSASAKFTCSDSRCKHEETVNATVSKSEEIGKTVYTAAVKLNGETYTDTKEIIHYSVTVADSTNGTVTADKNTALKGETVNLTVTPDDDYNIKNVTVTDSDGKAVTVDNNYSFVMPESDVTVKATFAVKTYNISVGGVGVTAKNSSDIFGNGTASYDFDTNTLTLTNANIEVKNGNGIRYNEKSKIPFMIVLKRNNRIAEVKDNGSNTCYGMALYAAAPGFIISGNGTLDIEMDSDNPRCGIHARKTVTISGAKVYVDVTGSENDVGIDLKYSDSFLKLENSASLNIHSGGIALQSNSNVRNLNVGNDCFFEAISDKQAVNRNINLTEGHPTVKVNTEPSADGSYNWDESTALTTYKYFSMRGLYAPCTVKWMIDDEVVETDTVPYGEMPQYSGSTPKKKADTLYTYTFKGWTPEVTAAEGDVTYTAVFESKEKEYQDGYNLTITDSIDVNIYLDIKNYFGGEDFTDQARAVLTYIDCNSEKPKTITEVIYLNKAELENGMFIKTITPAFAQIGENIKVQLYGNDGELITLANGKTEYNISVADYCKTLIEAGIYDEDIVRIAQAVLNYGKAASDYFKYTGAVIDGAETVELVDYNAIPILNQFTAGSTIEKMSSSTFRAISCTELKLYITGDASGVTITKATLAGTGNIKNDCKIEKGSDGRYFVRVSNLYAYELDKEITITFSDGSVKHFSVFDYIRSVLKNNTSEISKRMVSALYQYNRAVADFE